MFFHLRRQECLYRWYLLISLAKCFCLELLDYFANACQLIFRSLSRYCCFSWQVFAGRWNSDQQLCRSMKLHRSLALYCFVGVVGSCPFLTWVLLAISMEVYDFNEAWRPTFLNPTNSDFSYYFTHPVPPFLWLNFVHLSPLIKFNLVWLLFHHFWSS